MSISIIENMLNKTKLFGGDLENRSLHRYDVFCWIDSDYYLLDHSSLYLFDQKVRLSLNCSTRILSYL